MEDRQRTRILAGVAYTGLGIIIVSFALQAVHVLPIWIFEITGFGGIFVVAVGGFGLIAVSRQQMLRRVTPTTPPPPPPIFGMPAPGSVAPGINFDPAVFGQEVRFDLSSQLAAYRQRMRTAVWMRVFMMGFLAVLGVVFLVQAIVRGEAVGLFLGVMLFGVAGFGISVLRQVGRAPASVTIGPRGLLFQMVPAMTVDLPWTDPTFGVRLWEISADVNRAIDPARNQPTYHLFTGTGSGVGRGARILTALPVSAFALIIESARRHGLQVYEGSEGAPGTVSARRTFRITASPWSSAPTAPSAPLPSR